MLHNKNRSFISTKQIIWTDFFLKTSTAPEHNTGYPETTNSTEKNNRSWNQ